MPVRVAGVESHIQGGKKRYCPLAAAAAQHAALEALLPSFTQLSGIPQARGLPGGHCQQFSCQRRRVPRQSEGRVGNCVGTLSGTACSTSVRKIAPGIIGMVLLHLGLDDLGQHLAPRQDGVCADHQQKSEDRLGGRRLRNHVRKNM